MSILDFIRKNSRRDNIFYCDKVDNYWDNALEAYCKIHNIEITNLDTENMNEDEENLIWEYAGNHIAFFLIWAIQNQICDEETFEEEEIQLLKKEEISGTEFIMDYCDGKFYRELIKAPYRFFLDDFYMKKYLHDYSAFVENELEGLVFGIRFSWEIYHKFAPVLDRVYAGYGHIELRM